MRNYKFPLFYCTIATALMLQSCNKNKVQGEHLYIGDCTIEYIDTLCITCISCKNEQLHKDLQRPKFVILEEDDNTMFADINQIIDASGKFIIVDAFGGNKVVAFDYQGKPFASYGKRGNGPGEYILPCYVDANDEFVYILDPSQKKLHKYFHNGQFVTSMKLPFRCNAFALINNGNIVFNLAPSTKGSYQLCVTDSSLTPISYMLNYPDNFVDSWVTNNVFRKNEDGLTYYTSPLDTIYRLNYSGNIVGKRVLDFKEGAISNEAKLNFAEALETIETGLHLLDNPIELPSGISVYKIDAYSNREREKYIVLSNPYKMTVEAKKYGDQMSVYNIIAPQTLSKDNRIISFLDRDLAGDCYDFNSLPDSIIYALNEGSRVLVIHTLE